MPLQWCVNEATVTKKHESHIQAILCTQPITGKHGYHTGVQYSIENTALRIGRNTSIPLRLLECRIFEMQL